MRAISGRLALLVLFFLLATAAFAQVSDSTEALALLPAEDTPSVPDDSEFLNVGTGKAAWLLDYGVAVNPAAFYDLTGSNMTLFATVGASSWLRLSLPGQAQLYAKARDSLFLSILPWAASGISFSNLWDIDALYLQAGILEAGFTFTAGRKFYSLGSGLVLAGIGDGIEFLLQTSLMRLKVLGFYTGLLRPDFSGWSMGAWDYANGAQRYLGGYSAGINVFGQEISLLGLYQGDAGLEATELYTSWYSGLQLKGVVFSGEYLMEAYLQNGYSPLGSSTGSIQAFGGTARYQIQLPVYSSPGISIRYSLASGDPDRSSSRGAQGNTRLTDTAFQAFGTLNTGLAFRPNFSNMHIIQAGLSLNPLEAGPAALRRTSIGLRYFYYMKYAKAGVVTLGEAPLASHDLGHGIDFNTIWAPFTDLSLTLNAGIFLPGAAFAAGAPVRMTVTGGIGFSF
ncbi:MAG: alginate export family protein [Spirochaetes bacterium]|nr:alginate export family protein [Spirochaetota bacterium]MBU0954633.1 alginate export family protein [Spirochaetota bacterium]